MRDYKALLFNKHNLHVVIFKIKKFRKSITNALIIDYYIHALIMVIQRDAQTLTIHTNMTHPKIAHVLVY